MERQSDQGKTLMSKSLEEQVIDIVVEKLGVDREEVDPSKSFIEDLKADSLDLTDLIMTLELQFNCEISEEQAERIRTVGDAIEFVTVIKGTK